MSHPSIRTGFATFGSLLLACTLAVGCQHAPRAEGETQGAAADLSAEGERQERANRAARGLDGDDIRASEVTRVEELFVGRFAGVRVFHHPGGGIAIRIRGESSIYGGNEPLYVIDGMPMESGSGGTLAGLNPADIRRIEVLKDIGSTAFYGVRGANGVVLITTRGAR